MVLGIARGGLLVAGALGYALGVKNTFTMNVEFYTGIDERLDMPMILPPVPDLVDFAETRVLIADDVADTGATLKLVQEFCEGKVAEVRCAVLYEKPRSTVKCEYVWRRTERWITFPWSADDPVPARSLLDGRRRLEPAGGLRRLDEHAFAGQRGQTLEQGRAEQGAACGVRHGLAADEDVHQAAVAELVQTPCIRLDDVEQRVQPLLERARDVERAVDDPRRLEPGRRSAAARTPPARRPRGAAAGPRAARSPLHSATR